jgi:signal transduction histidine kinase
LERTDQINSVLWLGTAIMLFLGFVLISLVLFYRNFLSIMRRKEAEQLLLVSLESEKNERRRIAADLHDSVSGDLVAIRNYLTILQKSGNVSIDNSIFDELREGVENALQNTRQVSYKLMPPLLDSFGLAAAVSDNFERLYHKTSVQFSVEHDDSAELPAEISYELFRIIQEFTTNMLKYGSISVCKVKIYELQGSIFINIADDGDPFRFDKMLKKTSGTGLKNISSRLKVIGATLTQRQMEKGNDFIITLKRKK